MALDKLNETTAFARWNLDIGNFPETLEERTQLILGDIARQASNENGSVVWVGELVHGLRALLLSIVRHRRSSHWWVTHWSPRHGHVGPATHRQSLVLGSCSGDAHGPIAAVNALHLGESTLLIALVGEANETVAAGHARKRIGHDLCRLARRETALEEGDQDVFVNFGAQIADEDGVLGTTVVASISKATASRPVELERTGRVRHGLTTELKSLGSGLGGREVDKTITSVAATMSSET